MVIRIVFLFPALLGLAIKNFRCFYHLKSTNLWLPLFHPIPDFHGTSGYHLFSKNQRFGFNFIVYFKNKTLKERQVKLRKLKLSDTTQLAQLANNKKIRENVRDRFPHPYTEKDGEDFIELQSKNDTEQVFAIVRNGELCGLVGLIFQKDVYRKSAEIGYWLGEPYWGQGIGTKAVELIVQIAFEDLK